MRRYSDVMRPPLPWGRVLVKKEGGVERPVTFASRVLSPAERNYSASEREALACLSACENGISTCTDVVLR